MSASHMRKGKICKFNRIRPPSHVRRSCSELVSLFFRSAARAQNKTLAAPGNPPEK